MRLSEFPPSAVLSGQHRRVLLGAVLTVLIVVGAPLPVPAQIPSDVLRKSLKPTADVNDFAGILDPAAKAALELRCQELRHQTGAQLAVVIVKSLRGGQVDDFTNKLFAEWGVGQAGKNNGIMLLVALDDHKARIEVGYGLEPVLPDALAGRILREHLFPAFKQQRYTDGLTAAVHRMVEIVERGEPASAMDRRPRDSGMPLAAQIFFIGFSAIFVSVGGYLIGAGFGARMVFHILFGLIFGGLPFLMGCLIASPLAPVIHTCIAVFMGWHGWHVGRKHPDSFRSASSHSRQFSNDTWIWGASNGSSSGNSGGWSSGGFSSDSGSFGGGSSGGGGASGSW